MTVPRVRSLALFVTGLLVLVACDWRGPAPTDTSAEIDGTFEVASTTVPAGNGFGGGTIWYPTNDAKTYGGVAVVPGYVSPESSIAWYGPRLASHGFVVITIATNSIFDQPPSRGDQLLAALDFLTGPSSEAHRVDPDRLAVMGWSMGGGGSLHAAEDRATLRAAVPLAGFAFTSDWSSLAVPTMLVGCENDGVAVNAFHSEPFYESIPASTSKAYLEIAGGSHGCVTNVDPTISEHVVAWLKLHVDGDTRYEQFVCPPPEASGPISEYRDNCAA